MCSGERVLTATDAPQQFSDGSGAGHYSSSMRCEWTINAPPGRLVRLTFTNFELQSTGECVAGSSDYVEVWNDGEAGSTLHGRFCGSTLPGPVLSTSSSLRVVFRTDASSATDRGFTASYRAVNVPTCRGTVSLTAPGEPEVVEVTDGTAGGVYGNDLDCTWHISAADAESTLVLAFHSFAVDGTAPWCSDVVQVFDGASTDDTVIGRFCGYSLPEPLFTSGSNVTVRFRTDSSRGSQGFRLFVAAVQPCSERAVLSTSRGIVTDGNGRAGMPESASCAWAFDARGGERPTLVMHAFNLPCGPGGGQGLTLFSGPSTTSEPLKHWCGDSAGSNITVRAVAGYPDSLLRLVGPESQQAASMAMGAPQGNAGFVATFANSACRFRRWAACH